MSAAVRTVTRPAEVAGYIEQSTAELRDLAVRNGFSFLGYLIDMARLEAAATSARAERGEDPSEPKA